MSPKIHEEHGYRFYFYSGDVVNEPAHIHIKGPRGKMKIWLNTLEIAECKGISSHEQNRLLAIVEKNQDKFLDQWNQHKKRL
jgi:hypothetical protein